MTRFFFTYLILFITTPTFAQTDQKETTYTPPMPFSPYAESHQYNIQRLYESLPNVSNTKDIPGTHELVNAEIKNILSGKIQWQHKNEYKNEYWTGTNLLPIGKHKIEIRNLKADYYFWFIYGKVQFFIHKGWDSPGPAITKTTENYCIILHFKKGDARAYVDYFTVGNAIIKYDSQILDKVSKEATELLAKANEKAYETVKTKNNWTIDKRTETGQFDTYRNEKVTLTKNNTRTSYDIKRFSYDDQLLIRGYIDHQGIPARNK